MAIADVAEYAHLTADEVEQLGREFDAIRAEIEESRGAKDAAYINKVIRTQRWLAVGARIGLIASSPLDKKYRRPVASRTCATARSTRSPTRPFRPASPPPAAT